MAIVLEVLKQVLKSLLVSLVTEKFVKELIIFGLEKLAKKTDNQVDDELVAKVKEAMKAPAQPQK